MGTALDDLIDLLDLEQLEVNLFRGREPRRGPPARVRRAGRGAGARRRRPHRRPRARALAARVLPAARRPADPDHLRRRPHPRRPQLHDPPRRRDPARPGDLQPVGVVPRRTSTGPEHQYPMPDAPDPETLPTIRERLEPHADRFPPAFVDWIRRDRPIDTRSTELPRWLDPEPGDARARAARVVPRRRHAARRPAAARVRRRVRVRPHAARHRGDAARALVGRRPLHDREPRPRDVVPPAVPRRRVAAVPPAEPVGRRARAASPRASSSAHDGALAVTVIQEGLIRPVKPSWRDAVTHVDRPPLRHGHDADAGDAARDGRRRGRRRRVRRGPDRQPAASRSPPALLGKEAALYVPSGTMANQLALRVLAPPGTEVLCPARCARVPLRSRGRRR